MIKCSECGYENMDGLDYCDGCGAKLDAAAPQGAGASAGAPPAAAPHEQGAAASHEQGALHEQGGAATSAAPAAGETPAAKPDESAAGTSATNSAAGEEASRAPTGEIKQPAASPAAEEAKVAAAEAPPFKAKLAVIRGGRRGQEFELEPGNNLVGRWDPETGSFPEVDLDADDPEAKISRKHALIRLDGGKITIEDIGSLNGTYVNRQPRLQPGTPVEIKGGDEIIIGKTFLKLSIDLIS